MGKFFTTVILTVFLVSTVLLSATNTAIAQGAQRNESDLDFTRRMTARIESIEAQTVQLQSDEHGRTKVELDALMEQSKSVRTRLDTHSAASRTENRPAKLNREAIEATVSQMELDLMALRKDVDSRETTSK